MAGSNYDVNIKLDVRKINQQITNLERRISKLNALAQGKRGDSKTLLKNERDKAALLLKQERTQRRVNKELEKTNRLKKEELNLTKSTTKTGGGTKRTTVSGRPMGPSSPLNITNQGTLLPGKPGGLVPKGPAFTKGDISGALISGAFPLLFGQGPLGAAAGFTGGLIGSKIGGQTGGFAGGLVATAVLTQLQQLQASTAKLGQAFNRLTPDVEGLTTALGANGTEREKQIQLIKKTEGTQAALSAVTEQLNQQIGEKGVKNLKEFGETSRLIGNAFQLLGTKMLAALAPVLNLLATPLSGPAKRAERDRLAGVGGAASDPTLLALQNDLANVSSSGRGRSGTKRAADRKAEIQALIEARKEELALIGEGLERQQTVNMIEDSRLKKIRQQNALLQAKIDGNYEEVLLAQELDAKIKEMIEDGAKLEELDVNKIENLLKQNKELEKQAEQAEKIRQEFQQLGQSLATDVADGLKGLIKGTSTLGDMINSVLDKMLDAAINMAMFGNLSGTLGSGGFFGLFGGLFSKKTETPKLPSDYNQRRFGFMRAAGGPVKGGKSYIVGERGPEMFTPGVSGGITPNHALGGSTNVNVNVDASGSSVEGDAGQAEQLGEAISQAIQAELIQQKRPGGILYS